MEPCRSRGQKRVICIYLLTFVVIVLFFYHLLANNKKSILALTRLKEDVECLSNALKQQMKKSGRKPCDESEAKFSCMEGETQGISSGSDNVFSASCDPREINAQVDAIVKRKLGSLMDDMYNMKKQISGSNCLAQATATNNEAITLMPKTRINYAADDLGARIINVQAKPIESTNFLKSLLGLDFSGNPPINMLRSSIAPGACFGFSGTKATVSIRLAQVILVEEIALTHISKDMTPKMCTDNAPKEFEVHGINHDNKKKECLGNYTYENSSKRTQKFCVKNKSRYRNLIFTFNTNHGSDSTCVYRVEVYGRVT